jgi:hypothetical protein
MKANTQNTRAKKNGYETALWKILTKCEYQNKGWYQHVKKKASPQVQNIQVKKKYQQEAVGTIAYFPITQATSNNSSIAGFFFFWCWRNTFTKPLPSNDGWIHMHTLTFLWWHWPHRIRFNQQFFYSCVYSLPWECLLSQCLAMVRGHT